jgi:hypothetical protein
MDLECIHLDTNLIEIIFKTQKIKHIASFYL